MTIELFVWTCYMLVGFQIAARLFYWARRLGPGPADSIIILMAVPLAWPAYLLLALFDRTIRNAIFHWDDK